MTIIGISTAGAILGAAAIGGGSALGVAAMNKK